MIFMQKGIPTIASTSDRIAELMSDITLTNKDSPDKVDCQKLVELAEALRDLVIRL
jgi:aminopeptidase YwaD